WPLLSSQSIAALLGRGCLLVIVAWDGRPRLADQEVKVDAPIRLQDMINVELGVAPRRMWGRRHPGLTAPLHLCIIDVDVQTARSDIEGNHVATSDEGQRPPCASLGSDMEHDGPIRGAGHARVGHTYHVTHTFAQQLLRDRHVADFRHAWIAFGTA